MTALRRRALTTLALLSLSAGFVAAAAAPGEAATTFRAVALAKAVSGQFSNPGQVPLGAVVETSGQSAQATIDQLGTSLGFASHPYPGDFVVGVPGLINGVGGLPAPVPDYPFYVASNKDDKPEAKASGPGFSLEAKSIKGSSTAAALGAVGDTDAFRTGRGRAQATTSAASDGTITAKAMTEVDSVSVAGLLRFGRVATNITVTRSATGALTRTSSLAAEDVSVAGQTVGLVDGKLVVAGSNQPLPSTPLGDVLKQAGISVGVVAPTDTPEGRDGGALLVTVVNTNPETGTTTAKYRIGGATAFISFGGSADPAPPVNTDAGNLAPAPPSDAIIPAGGTASGPIGVDRLTPPPTTAEIAVAEVAAAAQPVLAAPQSNLHTIGTAVAVRSDVAWLYFAFVAAALALFGSSQVLRQYGIKARI